MKMKNITIQLSAPNQTILNQSLFDIQSSSALDAEHIQDLPPHLLPCYFEDSPLDITLNRMVISVERVDGETLIPSDTTKKDVMELIQESLSYGRQVAFQYVDVVQLVDGTFDVAYHHWSR